MTLTLTGIEIMLGICTISLVMITVLLVKLSSVLAATAKDFEEISSFVNHNKTEVLNLIRAANQEIRLLQRLTQHLDETAKNAKSFTDDAKGISEALINRSGALVSGIKVGLDAWKRRK